MTFAFVRWRRTKSGRAPSLPPRLAYLVVADGGRDSEWALVAVDDGTRLPAKTTSAVADQLAVLLESAVGYPPALALAAEDLARLAQGGWGPAELSRMLVRRLRYHLRMQHRAGYVLAEARRDEAGYLSQGEFYWLIGRVRKTRSGPERVGWVSRDYCTYTNAARDFHITPAQRKSLPCT